MVDRQTLVFQSLLNAAYVSRLHRLMGCWTQGSGVVFTLHSLNAHPKREFDPNYLLDITPEFLEKSIQIIHQHGFDCVSLDEALIRLADPQAKKFVALTFDDGYRSVRDYALPILAKYNVPSTLFVTSSFAEGTGELWWLQLEYILRHAEEITVTFNGQRQILPLHTHALKKQAWKRLYWRLRTLDEPFMRAAIAQLARKNNITLPNFAKELCMTWDELRDVARDPLVTIGAHTVNHYMLAKWPESIAREELEHSANHIKNELGVFPRHLAYPVGDCTSAHRREFALAKEVGFAAAWTTRPGHLFSENLNHPTALPRLSLNGNYQDPRYLEMFLSGLPVMFWNRFRKVNVY